MTEADTKMVAVVKDLEQGVSYTAAKVVANEYLFSRKGMTDFNQAEFISACGPHLRRSDFPADWIPDYLTIF
jgi:hypothetical protein